MSLPELVAVSDPAALEDPRFDAVVLVHTGEDTGVPALDAAFRSALALDARAQHDVSLVPAKVSGGRLVLAPSGRLDRDYDDVRRVADAALAGVMRARDAGAQAPLLWLPGANAFPRAGEVALLGALAGLWEPLEAREALGEETVEPVRRLGFLGARAEAVVRSAAALEQGKRLARDLAGTEPERMRPEAFAASCVDALADSPVSLRVIDELDTLGYQYPLLMGVARASLAVERHRPRVIDLEYVGEGPIQRTLFLAGKGLTYDTGGSDLKTGGHMAGMSRDKGGAAAVVGIFRVLAALRPRGLRVVGSLGVLRNSIGPDGYVSDEIIRSHAGVRVRVGNTDAEGRLVLADLLSHLRVQALEAEAPTILSLATLTGHAHRAMGGYSILIENGPARAARVADTLDALGEAWGDPFERSRLRREDYDFIKPRSKADDVLSANTVSSAITARGHQYPTAFLTVASGLAQHGSEAAVPLPFTHIDIAGSSVEGGDWQHGRPTAAAVTAVSAWVLGLHEATEPR
jgi:leucyl aminopeptidase